MIDYSYRGLRISQSKYIKELRKDQENVDRYNELKKKYSIGTYTTKELRKMGATKEDIDRYYEREIQLLTGDYEYYRVQQYLDNYVTALKKHGVHGRTINTFIKLFEGRSLEERQYMITLLNQINVHYKEPDIDVAQDLRDDIKFIRKMLKKK